MPDYPDFTQYAFIDIIAQSLGRILNRPTYGGAITTAVGGVVPAGAAVTLIEIIGEGMIYGGKLRVSSDASQADDYAWANIDGTPQASESFGSMMESNLVQPYGLDFVVCNYDEIDFEYDFIFSRGFTFEESCLINYAELSGNDPVVTLRFFYALT